MSTPSKPVNIRSPRLGPTDSAEQIPASYSTPLGTPDLRALRAQYVGTPPPPNIPLRTTGTPGSVTSGSPGLVPPTVVSRRISLSALTATPIRRPGTPGTPGSTSNDLPIPVLDDLPDEEKAKVLRRHLVSKDERLSKVDNAATSSDLDAVRSSGSRPSSSSGNSHTPARSNLQREDTETFPIPYHAPGADVT